MSWWLAERMRVLTDEEEDENNLSDYLYWVPWL